MHIIKKKFAKRYIDIFDGKYGNLIITLLWSKESEIFAKHTHDCWGHNYIISWHVDNKWYNRSDWTSVHIGDKSFEYTNCIDSQNWYCKIKTFFRL